VPRYPFRHLRPGAVFLSAGSWLFSSYTWADRNIPREVGFPDFALYDPYGGVAGFSCPGSRERIGFRQFCLDAGNPCLWPELAGAECHIALLIFLSSLLQLNEPKTLTEGPPRTFNNVLLRR
jgi:hypothetical protein